MTAPAAFTELVDVVDEPGERAAWPSLSRWLDAFSARDPGDGFSLSGAALASDARALQMQRRHRQTTLIGIVSGLAALVALAWSLSLSALCHGSAECAHEVHRQMSVLTVAELALLVMTAITVGSGLYQRYHHHWLLERYRTERLRFLKFATLADPDAWMHDAPLGRAAASVRQEARALARADERDMRTWAESPLDIVATVTADDGAVVPHRELADYYRLKRLTPQLAYFHDRGTVDEGRDARLRYFPTWLFFVGLICAGAHVVAELAKLSATNATFVLFALVALFLAAGVRTYRAARERARNTARFRATEAGLRRAEALLGVSETPVEVLAAIKLAEAALVNEHREWLRLMIEAEWFG